MGITELSNAYVLCTCGAVCSRACTVCSSTTWSKGPCVQQLWRQHIGSAAGREAAQRFNDMIELQVSPPPQIAPVHSRGSAPGPDGVVCGNGCDAWNIDPQCPQHGSDPVLTDEQIVERTIDFAEQLGMYMEPWQAAALRAILLHGGDVAIGRGY